MTFLHHAQTSFMLLAPLILSVGKKGARPCRAGPEALGRPATKARLNRADYRRSQQRLVA
jgi:hypothetical protein